MRALVLATAVVAVALAGCSTGGDDATLDDTDPNVVTRPDDYTYVGNATLDNGGHIHDYWGGQERLVLLEQTAETGSIWFGDEPIPVASFRPEYADVVPQGAQFVEITMSWQDESLTGYSPPELWVKTAADDEPGFVQFLEKDETVRIESDNGANDLPHQTLSAWIFEFRTGRPDPDNPLIPMDFPGTVTAKVEVERGLPIPVYPAHPDRWENRTEITLLSISDTQVFYDGDPTTGSWRCYTGDECPWVKTPDDGAIVPWDADRVEIVLSQDETIPAKLGMAFHGGEGREFQKPAPDEASGGTRTYVIPVDQVMADGPYALQSLWEFVHYPEEPQEDGYVYQVYDLTITAYKDPA